MTIDVSVIGAGPAGLMAAEQLAAKGFSVRIFDALPSPGRKFLMAGRGGLNLTHSEDLARFKERYGAASPWMAPLIDAFPPSTLTQWCEGLGEATFIGSSGRIFPRAMKASPLLRAWLRRLSEMGVTFALRHRWLGWRGDALLFSSPEGEVEVKAKATLLALGGASWPKLGSGGEWAALLAQRGVKVQPLQPANCGVQITWSSYLTDRFAGQPIKPLVITCAGQQARGEAVITASGLEGGALYSLTPAIRGSLASDGQATLSLDLQPTLSLEDLVQRLARAPSGSLSTRLKRAGLSPAAIALLHEGGKPSGEAEKLAAQIKAFPLTVLALSGLERAISTAGGIALEELDQGLMLRALPGVFAAGEMLDWEAPTGGFLLQGCFATAVAAAKGIEAFLQR